MQRMDCKQDCHNPTAPHLARHPSEQKEYQQAIDQVEKYTGHMMPAWTHSEEFNIQHVRQPGNRVPIAGTGRPEGPDDAFFAQPLTHIGILCHIFIIVITDKIMCASLPVYGKCGQDKKNANDDIRQ